LQPYLSPQILGSTAVSRLNKENAISFYRQAYLGEPAKAIEKYVGDDYRSLSLTSDNFWLTGVAEIKASLCSNV